MVKQWRELFPEGKQVTEEREGAIPLPDGSWYLLDEHLLTAREQLLVNCLSGEQNGVAGRRTPWQRYLTQGGDVPVHLERVQFVHVKIKWSEKSISNKQSLQEMLAVSLPNLQEVFYTNGERLVLVFNQLKYFDIGVYLSEILPLLREDFSCRLTVLLGQVWPAQLSLSWSDLYQQEEKAFTCYLNKSGRSEVLSFSNLLMWLGARDAELSRQLLRILGQIVSQFEMEEIVLGIWEEKAVQTKAAQRLYLHRNTLQNKLDRFLERTGLDLKDLDDLSLCYLAIQSQTL